MARRAGSGHTTGTLMRAVRTAAGKTLDETARILGVTQQTYWRYETGRSMPRLDVAQKFARHFGCSLADLLPERAHK